MDEISIIALDKLLERYRDDLEGLANDLNMSIALREEIREYLVKTKADRYVVDTWNSVIATMASMENELYDKAKNLESIRENYYIDSNKLRERLGRLSKSLEISKREKESLIESLSKAEKVSKELESENIDLKVRLESTLKELSIYKDINEQLAKENKDTRDLKINDLINNLESIYNNQLEILEIKKTVDRILNNNSGAIRLNEAMKRGDKVDNRKKSVDEKLLVELYNNGDTTLTNEQIGELVGLTGAGVKARLVKMKIYRPKRKDFGVRR